MAKDGMPDHEGRTAEGVAAAGRPLGLPVGQVEAPAVRVRRMLAAKPEALAFLERLAPDEVQALYDHLARYAIRVAAGAKR